MIFKYLHNIKIKKQVRSLLNSVSSLLTQNDVINAKDLIEHEEWGIAFELIYTQLHEYDAVLSVNQIEKIKQLADLMELEDDCWDCLLQKKLFK